MGEDQSVVSKSVLVVTSLARLARIISVASPVTGAVPLAVRVKVTVGGLARLTLVIAASILMIVEMTVMLLMPAVDRSQYEGDSAGLANAVWILFAVFMVNIAF